MAKTGHAAIDEFIGEPDELDKELEEALGEETQDKSGQKPSDDGVKGKDVSDDADGKSDEQSAAAKEDNPEVEPESLQEKYDKLQNAHGLSESNRREQEKKIINLEKHSERFEKIATVLEGAQYQAQEASDEEKFNQNPASYLKDEIKGLRNEITGQRAVDNQAQEGYQTYNTIAQSAAQYAEKQPDYSQAVDFMKERRFKEYELYNIPRYVNDPNTGQQMDYYENAFNQECYQFGQHQIKNGKDPAESAYEYAQIMGYTVQEGGGHKPAKGATTTSRLKTMAEGQKASGTLEGGGESESVIKKIDDMSEDEFDEYFEGLEKQSKKAN